MKVKIKKVVLENYKNFTNPVEFVFSDKTEISGRNASGKTTIMNAYMEVLTGKQVDGTQPDAIRPHKTDGSDLNRSDVIRAITLDVDGKEIEIKKITKQKWRKPHGQTEEVLDGNSVSYEIDGFAYAPKKFEEFMKTMFNPETLLICSNPNSFLSILKKSTVEARGILEVLAGFVLEDFIASNPKYNVISEITKGHSIEETTKALRKKLNEQKKKRDQKETEIKYESIRDTSFVNIDALEEKKAELNEEIFKLDHQEQELDEAVKAYDALNSEIIFLKSKLNDIEFVYDGLLMRQRADVNTKIAASIMANKENENSLKLANMELKHLRMGMEKDTETLNKARTNYKTVFAKEFDNTKLNEIESEQFDENNFICPECGQVRPEVQRINLKEAFESGKSKRISEEKKKREEFEASKEADLKNITEIGNNAAQSIKKTQIEEKEILETISRLENKIDEVKEKIVNLNEELDGIPEKADLTHNPEYQTLLEQISDKEKQLSSLSSGTAQRIEIRNKRREYTNEISNIDAQLFKVNEEAETKKRKLRELEAEFNKQKQLVADIERNIDVLNQFSIEKNAALAEKINPYFKRFKFNFLRFTNDGNPVEVCELVCNGTEYGDLNYSDRLLVECDMVNGFQKMNDIKLPIWVDNSESINDDRLPELDTQMIVLKVTNKTLKVEGN